MDMKIPNPVRPAFTTPQRDDTVIVYAHQAGCFGVFGGCTHGPTQSGPVHQCGQAEHQQHRTDHDECLNRGHGDAAAFGFVCEGGEGQQGDGFGGQQ